MKKGGTQRQARLRAALAGVLALWAMVSGAGAGEARAAGAGERPRIGLVLGGGGARGSAHIGVLEVMERLRVPVDCVAGTSMGSLVAGVYGTGLTPAQMLEKLAPVDWNDLFADNPESADMNYRSRRLAQRFYPRLELGITDKGVEPVAGVVAGQKIKLFFNHLVGDDTGLRTIESLRLPVSVIATDIGTGERVVLREGSLSAAMRASMSVPGLMAPVQIGSHYLVDGGLVDNVPAKAAWRAVHKGFIGTRNAFILAMNGFAPKLTTPLWLPLERLAELTVTANRPYAHLFKDFKKTLSPLELVPSVEMLTRAIEMGRRQMTDDLPFLSRMMTPLPPL